MPYRDTNPLHDEPQIDSEPDFDEDEYFDEDLDDERQARVMFADPGGKSALRAETPSNPRNLPCPTCHAPDRLTPADVAQGYQCDRCADAVEGGF